MTHNCMAMFRKEMLLICFRMKRAVVDAVRLWVQTCKSPI
jgi:hypothetical protein